LDMGLRQRSYADLAPPRLGDVCRLIPCGHAFGHGPARGAGDAALVAMTSPVVVVGKEEMAALVGWGIAELVASPTFGSMMLFNPKTCALVAEVRLVVVAVAVVGNGTCQ